MTGCSRSDELEVIFSHVDDCNVDCNGMSMIIASLLSFMGLRHEVMLGYVKHNPSNNVVTPHVWINLNNGYTVDYRLRKWLGDNDNIPHGVFEAAQYKNEITYIDIGVLPNSIAFEDLEDLEDITEGSIQNIDIGVLNSVRRRRQDFDLDCASTFGVNNW